VRGSTYIGGGAGVAEGDGRRDDRGRRVDPRIVDTTAGGDVSGCTSVLGAGATARSCGAMEGCGAREGFAAGVTSWKRRSSIGADLRLEKPKNWASAFSPARHSSSAARGRERRDVDDLGAGGASDAPGVSCWASAVEFAGAGFSAGAAAVSLRS
jgi:hypothetical protein